MEVCPLFNAARRLPRIDTTDKLNAIISDGNDLEHNLVLCNHKHSRTKVDSRAKSQLTRRQHLSSRKAYTEEGREVTSTPNKFQWYED